MGTHRFKGKKATGNLHQRKRTIRSEAIQKQVDKEDKSTAPIQGTAYETRAIVINESGLYALILTRQNVVSGQGLQHDYLGGDRNESL